MLQRIEPALISMVDLPAGIGQLVGVQQTGWTAVAAAGPAGDAYPYGSGSAHHRPAPLVRWRSTVPRIVRGTFVPHADLASLDPVWTTADVTRNFSLAVYDTLYGYDAQFKAQPQMVEGHTSANDGKQWDLTLRDGLKFHDGAPVLARDCVATIMRWAQALSDGTGSDSPHGRTDGGLG